MVVLNDYLLPVVPFYILAVYLGPGVFPLAESADIKIIVQNALHRGYGPGGLGPAFALLAVGLLPQLLRHSWGGYALVSEVVCYLFIAPALVVIELKYLPHYVRLGGHHFKVLAAVDDVAVGGGAYPLPVGLPALDHVSDLPGGVGDGHLVDQKLELYLQPVIIIGEVYTVPDGYDAHPGVPQILQLHQAPAVAPGETGEVLDNKYIVFMAHEAPAHLLVALPLVEGIAGAVPVFKESQAAAGEILMHIVFNDGLLVLDGYILLVQLVIHGNAGVTRYVKGLGHTGISPLSISGISKNLLLCIF